MHVFTLVSEDSFCDWNRSIVFVIIVIIYFASIIKEIIIIWYIIIE